MSVQPAGEDWTELERDLAQLRIARVQLGEEPAEVNHDA